MYTKEDHDKKVKEFVSICREMADLYAAKNWDYGDSFGKSFEEWGMPMSCIRLTDKLNRLSALLLRILLRECRTRASKTLLRTWPPTL